MSLAIYSNDCFILIMEYIELIYFMVFAYLVVFLLAVGLASAAKMVDLYGRFSDFSCLAEQGYSRTVIRAYHSYGAIDIDAAKSIPLSNQAGLTTDVYMFPCRGKNATAQVN